MAAVDAGCPPAERLLELASGSLVEAEAAQIEAHIDTCDGCRAALSSAVRGDEPPRFGRYRIETVLGSGGMGIVYRARDPDLGRAVAIKVVRRAGDDAAARARLAAEARSLARVSHRNVCHVYDVGTDGDEVWVAMELIDGCTLRQWAGERGDPAATLAALLAAADGLAAAHDAGLVHRDVKPENVLMARDGRAVVTDFGLARLDAPIDPAATTISGEVARALATSPGAIAGTPAYLAPEQLTGEPVDARADQFAWAVMAWELLAGVRPFPAALGARLEAIHRGVTAPASIAPAVAEALARALSPAPRERFADMRALADAVRAAAAADVSRSDASRRAGVGATPGAPSVRARRGGRAAQVGIGALVVAAAAAAVVAVATSRRAGSAPADAGGVAALGGDEGGSAAPVVAGSKPAPELEQSRTPSPSPSPTPTPTPTPTPIPMPSRMPMPMPTPIRMPMPMPTPSRTPTPMPGPSPMPTPTSTPTLAPDRAPSPMAVAAGGSGDGFDPELSHDHSVAVLVETCTVPLDVAHPSAGVTGPFVDVGRITRTQRITVSLSSRAAELRLVEVRGTRATYRFADRARGGTIGAGVGDLVAVCAGKPESDVPAPPDWSGLVHLLAAVRLTAPPRLSAIADLHATFLFERRVSSALPSDHRYWVRAFVSAAEPSAGGLPRFSMGRWSLEVPAGTPGADRLHPGEDVWLVIDTPRDDGDRAVARAVAVLDDPFS